ncbi:glutamate ABC transporter substrate-binding protein [Glycomyces paridis]|uniref:Glutamate ABC transporter substrate-binding protein n=1 Tax=Glycomyces paridis TaxID=2126555 RepID=A0A4S8PDV4_9ACTN|nr:glutamate ABC transporter substrate-binding protein [Glycomyces paridis]THV28583.1 glutamate ABC transporter substrate-binding protein [Glycomyces paridis]
MSQQRNRTHRTRLAAAAAALTGLLLAACAGPADMEPPEVDVPTPLPAGIDFSPEVTASVPDDSCDPLASFAPGAVTADQARAQLDNDGQISIGISQSTNLLGYRDPVTNSLAGFDIDIARAVATALLGEDPNIKWVPMTSNQREDSLKEDRVDLVVRSMSINCGRWENIDFSAEYYRAGQRLLVTKDSGIEGVADLTADHTVCTGAGSTSGGNIAAANDKAQQVTVPDFNDCLMLLQQGTVDAISTDDTILAGMAVQDPTLEIVGEAFSVESYGIGVQKDNTDLTRFVNAALEDLIADGTWANSYGDWLEEPLGTAATAPTAVYRD